MSEQEMSQEDGMNSQAGEGEDDTAPRADELTLLKARANMLGITFSNNIGIDALRKKVAEKMTPTDEEVEDEEEVAEEPAVVVAEVAVASPVTSLSDDERNELNALRAAAKSSATLNPLAGDTAGEVAASKLTKREKIRREAMALVRCRITNLDPKKKDLHGEILCVGNKYIGTVKKFIPYGEVTDEGFHIPKVLYDELESRRFLHIQTGKNKQNGQITVKSSYAKEFAIEVLPMLTPDQLAKLAAAQLAASNS